jgi:hypothetical protein
MIHVFDPVHPTTEVGTVLSPRHVIRCTECLDWQPSLSINIVGTDEEDEHPTIRNIACKFSTNQIQVCDKFYADPDSAFYLDDPDPDTDPGSQTNADPDSGQI